MKTFETNIQRQTRTAITEILEEVIDVPREYWEVMRTKQDNEVKIRQIFIYFLNHYTTYNQKTIAELLGLRNHTSVLRNLRVVESWFESPEENSEQISIINKVKQIYEQRNS